MKSWKVAALAMAVALAASACTTLIRSSVTSGGVGGNGYSRQRSPRSISDDGRYVLFASTASNLVANDTNGAEDVFRHDNQTGQTIRVSVTSTGAQIPAESIDLGLSGTGNDAVFRTAAALEPADTNGLDDVYVRTISTGKTERVSLRVDGTPLLQGAEDGSLQEASISDDGRRVLVLQTGTDFSGMFVRDRLSATTEYLGFGHYAVLSGDGASVAFTAFCSGVCSGRAYMQAPTFGADVELIDPQCGFNVVDMSANGRFVIGERYGIGPTYTCSGPTGLTRWDRVTKVFTAVPIESNFEVLSSISNDGRFVGALDRFLRVHVTDLATGVTQSPAADAFDRLGDGPDFGASLSGNGRFMSFTTASHLAADDAEGFDDVYTRFVMQPSVRVVAPSTTRRGAAHTTLTVTGTEFLYGVNVSISQTGVTVNSVELRSPTTLVVDISVAADATVQAYDVNVTNRSGFGSSVAGCHACLQIN